MRICYSFGRGENNVVAICRFTRHLPKWKEPHQRNRQMKNSATTPNCEKHCRFLKDMKWLRTWKQIFILSPINEILSD